MQTNRDYIGQSITFDGSIQLICEKQSVHEIYDQVMKYHHPRDEEEEQWHDGVVKQVRRIIFFKDRSAEWVMNYAEGVADVYVQILDLLNSKYDPRDVLRITSLLMVASVSSRLLCDMVALNNNFKINQVAFKFNEQGE